jgi:beta-lactamase superfamily II metal-dependent hydrolase
MFELFSLQAEHGDAMLIRYGDTTAPYYVMVDGGPSGTAKTIIEVLDSWRADKDRLRLEALVVTHYDLDHIEGIIELLENKPTWLEVKDIWFNGLRHLIPADLMGPAEGNRLSQLIEGKYSWNGVFGNRSVRLSGVEPVVLDGGMKVWVLSPTTLQLRDLSNAWRSDKLKARDDNMSVAADLLGRKDTWPPGKFTAVANTKPSKDASVPNGSSIALMLEFGAKKLLLAGDAYSDVVENGIKTCWKSPPNVELCKLSHHGSQANTSPALLKAIHCRRFLISTSGKIHRHPDHALVARLLAHTVRPEIIFNYALAHTLDWQVPPQGWPAYIPTYPRANDAFVRADLMQDP